MLAVAVEDIPPFFIRDQIGSFELQMLDRYAALQDVINDFILELTSVVKSKILDFRNDGEYLLVVFGLELY